MKTKKYTKQELIVLLNNFAQKIGQTPKKRLLQEDVDMPSEMTFRVSFGSWGNALKESGFIPTKFIPIGARKGSRNKKGVKKILNKWGYYEIFEPKHPLAKKNGYIREHRLVAYNAGLLKNPKHEVHHINGIKTDNRLSNLSVITKEAHTSLTWKGIKGKNGRKKKEMENLHLL